ncbi:hypothetical protein ISN45_At02g040300 [Arabidopsis thaliana x Arabidopsis arenosa]|uniref:Expressed protein n=4 Tax=Arabidopsis TaxID=3701 RepID=O22159_ARATH|nr:transmembrane protein, putative (DUF247) [Arabidopsis thaliana]KAG7639751.1 hypothetical protein ISN45_At02g040300 [Arabidopsis thaliana x Arabidopsis arenosa]AAC31831.2 expressed protein [Arabidopsis thaliana]AAL07048.1 unknown protein [Arabidopsis thaliana]AAM20278.1 unknown protein [Arabidopsis thaliana]AEC10487.1 transmembrane protein, putative (DUF247) [Arabidopsis thaliana]|eukprot:NP_566032.1 transmembrane protein, putative (DUF247) [Arabidopsis thaliana]
MAKEKQPLMEDLEQGIQLSTRENETGSGKVGRWSEGFRDPLVSKHGTAEKAKIVSVTTKPYKPDSCYESEISGIWPSSFSKEYCCIYRVPNRLRRVNPEAYTPQMLLIGPLQHSKKANALELSKTDLRYLDYMNMELHKKKYLNAIANKYGDQIIEVFKEIIETSEKFVRESYAESTDWIKPQDFVDMILLDSVFILGVFIQAETTQNIKKKEEILFHEEDIIFQEPCLITTILEDLILLENQLPYVLLEKLSKPFFANLKTKETFRDIILRAFRLKGEIKEGTNFRHFTDLFRRVRVETLCLTKEQIKSAKDKPPEIIKSLHNADKLDSAGVDFVRLERKNDLSLVITFERGILEIPCFLADDNTERIMRNLMALEQCHYPLTAYVCNYIAFLDFLIDTDQDVDLLVKKGVIKNWLGHQASVAEMVNKLCLGLVDFGSHYYGIADRLNKHYESRRNRSIATLRRVYFKDLWTGTATIAAAVILVLTLIGTVASVLQVTQKDNNSPPPPAMFRGP